VKLICEGCGAEVEPSPAHPYPFVCPNAGQGEVDHLLAPLATAPWGDRSGSRPFLDFADLTLAHTLAIEHGIGEVAFRALVDRLDRSVAQVDGVGFVRTPLARSAALEQLLDVAEVWVKDETGSVAGSHKARHLFGLAVYLDVVEALGWTSQRPRLAIASCGNAGLAAGVIAAAAERPLDVFLPTDADPVVVERLQDLGAAIHVCERTPGQAGDPTLAGFQAAVRDGALPFCCQGNECGLTLEGGFTLGWELSAQLAEAGASLDAVFVQVGGGALGSSLVRSLTPLPRVFTVQTLGAAPLARATERVAARASANNLEEALAHAAAHRSDYMWPWETAPHSVAHGILDDETYDWHALVSATLRTDGAALLATEAQLLRAHDLVNAAGVRASHTGTAGVAGLIAAREAGLLGADARVLVLVTGVER